jgi:hypothetical protein
MDTKRGFQALKECLVGADAKLQAELAVLEQRLQKNERAERIYGQSENTRSEWAQIILSLNELALKHCGVSFNDLCEGIQSIPPIELRPLVEPGPLPSPGETRERIYGDNRTGSQAKVTVQIFLSYAREDEEKVESLYQKLSDAGFKPWMDKKDILPGERWEFSIRKAIRRSDFFLACLSANSVNRRGWIQKEIKGALDMWQEKLDSDIYLIPVRLADCRVPESLSDFQWVDLFEEGGWTRLMRAIQVGLERWMEVPADQEPSAERR